MIIIIINIPIIIGWETTHYKKFFEILFHTDISNGYVENLRLRVHQND